MSRLSKHKQPPRVAVLGIGHALRGDDGAGLLVARALQPYRDDHLLVLEAGHAPENHTGPVRRFAPDLVLLVDAAGLNQPPGAICWIDLNQIDGLSASTHTLPLSVLARYFTAVLNCEVALIGIQWGSLALDAALSPEVAAAATAVAAGLQHTLRQK